MRSAGNIRSNRTLKSLTSYRIPGVCDISARHIGNLPGQADQPHDSKLRAKSLMETAHMAESGLKALPPSQREFDRTTHLCYMCSRSAQDDGYIRHGEVLPSIHHHSIQAFSPFHYRNIPSFTSRFTRYITHSK